MAFKGLIYCILASQAWHFPAFSGSFRLIKEHRNGIGGLAGLTTLIAIIEVVMEHHPPHALRVLDLFVHAHVRDHLRPMKTAHQRHLLPG